MRATHLLVLPLLLLAGLLAASPARADGPPTIPVDTIVPDVRGLAASEVAAGLEAIYEIMVVEVDASFAEDGRVIGQRPRPGARLAFRGALRLEVGRAVVQTALPSVAGLDLAEAERLLLDQGIVPVPVFDRMSREGPFGAPPRRPRSPEVGMRTGFRVMRQDPAAGTPVGPETRVALHVRLPQTLPHLVRMPSLLGLTSAQAAEAARALGLVPRIRRTPSVFPRETIIDAVPSTGAYLRRGSVVQLVVAIPAGRMHVPAQTPVPDLTGARLPEAFELARAAGVRLAIRRRPAPEQAGDQILSQRPTAGVRVPLGTTIRVTLPLEATVPHLVGLAPDDASRRLEAVGLAVAFVGDARRAPRVRVVDQSPAAGQVIAAGTAVRVVLRGGGHAPRRDDLRVRVPDLRGLSLADATRALGEVGLVARPSFVRGAGNPGVTGQSAAPGTLLPHGTEVRITVRR